MDARTPRIEIEIKGRPDRGERVPLRTFVRAADNLTDLLAQIAADRGRNGVRVEWFVRELRQGSTVLATEPMPDSPEALEAASEDAEKALGGIAAMERGDDVRRLLSYPVVERVRSLSGLLDDGAGEIAVRGIVLGQRREIDLTASTAEHASALLARRYRSSGSVQGTIETLSVHERRPYFNVFHALDDYAIKCRCDEALFAQARAALRRRVRVAGEIVRRFDGRAETVEVSEIHVLPGRDELPQPGDIRGLVPDLTGGLPVSEWLRGVHG
jgi:hypothetical protein